ncbi:TPA: ATP-binding cassette domain-containing protein [Escherichia coli]|nr:ATP-binding cassette domain-containing protein [Escherichia coli]HAZ3502848.1 ATP-binding cassette domain-containing protein [Escherichia coli]HBA8215986.1 ATP-binding cassette domain-containing protein [Escherichia coli]
MIKLNIKSKTFDDRVLFDRFQLTIEKQDFIVLTGPSGAGKSTLLNIIGLLDRNYIGDYLFFGERIILNDYSRTLNIRKDYFGYIFQDSLINEQQSIYRNLLCSVDFSLLQDAKERTNSVLDIVGLSGRSGSAALLSGGEKQRLALARALIKQPSILLADEPTASLDKENKLKIMNILKKFNHDGGTVVMITHDLGLITSDMKIISIS